jgi:phosphate transport system substrate-binding protein
MKIYPEVTFDIQMGRSTKDALVMMFEGRIDLIPISRPLSRDEIGQFKNKFGYEPTQIGIAFEALGIYVNKNNPVKQLTLQQLDAIFSANLNRHGKIVETWEDLGVAGDLSKRRVLRFNLPSKGSAHIHFRDIVMLGGDYRLDVKIERTAGSLVQAVGANDAGIGFTAVIFATQRTRFVPIVADDGIAYLPTYENVVSGKYPLPRMLNFVINKKPGEALNPVILEYLKFATSRRGQRIIALDGSYPLTPESQKKSRGKFD